VSLFVSIASYRDPELVPTLRDLLAKADASAAIRVCVWDQVGPETLEFPEDLAGDPRVERVVVPWQESRGACWARAEIMKRYAGEDHFLQLDSHHRFVQGWDTILREELARTGRAKAILTGYVTAYHPGPPERRDEEPLELHFDAFHPDGIVVFRPVPLGERARLGRPIRARFLSAHFLFAHGAFVREVPYDADLYFIGEEISLTVRAFLEGWYFFHPSRVVVFHEYTRAYRAFKHWTDHEEGSVSTPWWERDHASKGKVAALLLGAGTRGSVRSLAEYEAYAGLSFVRQRAHPDTLAGVEPPTAVAPGWEEAGDRYAFHVEVPPALVAEATTVSLWQLWVRAACGTLLHRRDVYPHDLSRAAAEGGRVLLPIAFDAALAPRAWGLEPCVDPASPGLPDHVTVLSRVEAPIHVARAEPPATYVTALLDLGRARLADPRPYEEYLARFAELLDALGDARVVVHCHPRDEAFVRARRGARPTQVRALCIEDLAALPHAPRVDELRHGEVWRAQAPYLATSPQAALPHYAVLVLQKLAWLEEAARSSPDTTRFFWVDAGLTRTVAAPAVTSLGQGVGDGQLRLFVYPYPVSAPEIHGLSRAELTRLAGGEVTHVVRGGFFGGAPSAIRAARAAYDPLLAEVLAAGALGTEESLFSILHRRGEAPFVHAVGIGEDGLIPSWPFGRAPWQACLPSGPDRLLFARAARAIAELPRDAAPAHLVFSGGDAVAHAAVLSAYAHPGDLVTVAQEGAPSPTMAFVTAADVARAFSGLARAPSEGADRYLKIGDARAAPPRNASTDAVVYVLTYEAPRQLEAWLTSAARACPELLAAPRKVLVDNSTDAALARTNAALASAHGFEHLRFHNVGITGGRISATRHFLEETSCDQMWYFEDDMHLSAEEGLCRNGFPLRVPGLFEVVSRIVEGEAGLDGLKLSYTEHYGCHQLDWAWVNADEDTRAGFERGSATAFHAIRATGGVSYALGDVHYSHWPMVLTRRGAEVLFREADVPRDEAALMGYARGKARRGSLRLGVLLASPIEHRRDHGYVHAPRHEG